jgi:hypothetical protein
VSASPDTCVVGEYFDLTATFDVNVNANERYDAGFYFRVDGARMLVVRRDRVR